MGNINMPSPTPPPALFSMEEKHSRLQRGSMSPVASTRWCPTAEQIMILEEMYRGGIRTPNAAQIQQITAHLSLYGKIEGKNVFYWFQNHKARDRQKLRKRLLGKQLHLQQPQPQQQKQATLPDNISIVDQLSSNFQQHPPNYHNFLHQLHFDETPLPPPRYPLTPPSIVGFQQLHNFNNSLPSYTANHQARTNSYTWKVETTEANNGRDKSRPIRITHDDDWIMIGGHDDGDDDHDHDHEIGGGGTTTRPLKTLQLFPIKEKTSLKEQHPLSPPSHFHAYF